MRCALRDELITRCRTNRGHRVGDDVGQRIAIHLASRYSAIEVDVADVCSTGICDQQRITHCAIAIARPARDSPRTRAHNDCRFERRVGQVVDFKLIAFDVCEIQPIVTREVQRVGHLSAIGQRIRVPSDDGHRVHLNGTRCATRDVTTTVGIARKTSHGYPGWERGDVDLRAEGAHQRGERTVGRHRVGRDQHTGQRTNFVPQKRDADRITRFDENRVGGFETRRHTVSHDGNRVEVGRALHLVSDRQPFDTLQQRIDDKRRDGDGFSFRRIWDRQRVEHCDRILQRRIVVRRIGVGERALDIETKCAHAIPRRSRQRDNQRLANNHGRAHNGACNGRDRRREIAHGDDETRGVRLVASTVGDDRAHVDRRAQCGRPWHAELNAQVHRRCRGRQHGVVRRGDSALQRHMNILDTDVVACAHAYGNDGIRCRVALDQRDARLRAVGDGPVRHRAIAFARTQRRGRDQRCDQFCLIGSHGEVSSQP